MEGKKSEISDMFKNVLAEHKREGYASANVKNSDSKRLSSAQRILSFDPRLSTGDRNSYKASSQNSKTRKAALLMDQFSTNLLEMSLSSEMRPRAEKIYSMEVRDIFGELLEKTVTGMIYEELEVLATEKALTNCIDILIRDNFNIAITKEITKLPFTQGNIRNRADIKLISKEINRSLISKTVTRIIKRMSKEAMQIGYFGHLIYKGLLSKLTRRLIIINLFNTQCKGILLEGTANTILTGCIREMIEQELTQLMNQQDSVGLEEALDLPSGKITEHTREIDEEFANVLAERKNYNAGVSSNRNKSLEEEFGNIISNKEYNTSKFLIKYRYKKSFEYKRSK